MEQQEMTYHMHRLNTPLTDKYFSSVRHCPLTKKTDRGGQCQPVTHPSPIVFDPPLSCLPTKILKIES